MPNPLTACRLSLAQSTCTIPDASLAADSLFPSTTPTHVQVYGPRDGLFLPSLLMVAGSGKLRIFGAGENSISFCHGNLSPRPHLHHLVTLANTTAKYKCTRADRYHFSACHS